jgi:ankyrin repeat protein/outer membrane protein assembly factor BamB
LALAGDPNWPQFRGPGGLGIAPDDESYPAKLDPSHNLLWKTEIPEGHSSPCIWGDSIFITARSGDSLETICIDRRDGTVRWRKPVTPEAFEEISDWNSHAAPTPICDGERVYVHFGSFGLLAHDMNGNELWQTPLPLPHMVHGSAASPILAKGLVVINCDQEREPYLLAVDKRTGKEIWKTRRPVSDRMLSWSTPVLWRHEEDAELVVLGRERLISYDLEDGGERWWVGGLPIETASTPVYADETLFAAATTAFTGDPVNPVQLPDFQELLVLHDSDADGHLSEQETPEDLPHLFRLGPTIRRSFAQIDRDRDGSIGESEWNRVRKQAASWQPGTMDALVAIRSGGKGDIGESHVQWTANTGIGQVPSPLCYEGRIYLVKHGGNVTCYDAKTGRMVYTDRAGPRTYHFASPVAADGKIYFCSMNGFVIIVRAGDDFTLLGESQIGERIYATPALLGGTIYLRTDESLYAFAETKDDSEGEPTDTVASEEDRQLQTLYGAAANGDAQLVRSLIAGGADVNAPGSWGWTPLHVAAATGHEEIVSLLIAGGADPDALDGQRNTPVQLAIGYGYRDIGGLLIQNGADLRVANEAGETLLHTAAERDEADIAAFLIDRGADVNATASDGGTPLHYASWSGSRNTVQVLIDRGADISAKANDGRTPFHLARDKEVVAVLIEKGADPNTSDNRGWTLLHLASQAGNTDVVELLVTTGADADARANNGLTPLHLAARSDHRDTAERLISNGAELDTPDNRGWTPLHIAANRGRRDVAELLITEGADVEARDNTGLAPLTLAASRGHAAIVELLKKHGATEPEENQDSLEAAILSNDLEKLKELIAQGASVNAPDSRGNPPLLLATMQGRLAFVETLIAAGADVNLRNARGQTSLDVAIRRGRTEIAELLREHGVEE